MTAPLNIGPSIVSPAVPQAAAVAAPPQAGTAEASSVATPASSGDRASLSTGNGSASELSGATELWAEAVLTENFDHIGLPPDVPQTGVWSDALEIVLPEYKPTIDQVNIAGIGTITMPDRPTWRELTLALEEGLGVGQYRTDARGHKRDVLLNDDRSAFDTQAWGPQTTRFMREAYEALRAGDLERARRCYEQGRSAVSPIMLDLTGDGKLGTTGVSTAKERIDDQVGRTVSFDIDGDGLKDEIEWMLGDGDGMLVDDRDGGATGAMLTDGEIDGKRLFGDQGGKYANGYEKLKALDKDGDGKLTGEELDGLKVWIDDGDAKLEGGELKTLRELGITEISVVMKLEANARGEDLMRSSFVRNGETHVTEDVWFASK
jgi:hypothetical protein